VAVLVARNANQGLAESLFGDGLDSSGRLLLLGLAEFGYSRHEDVFTPNLLSVRFSKTMFQ
jgi:hypothetical protein